LTNVQDFQPQSRPAVERDPGHEPNNLSVRGLIGFAAALAAVIILVELVLAGMTRDFSAQARKIDDAPARFDDDKVAFPGPRLQAEPATDFARMKQADLDVLDGYGWVDRRAGIAHIPIERAFDILLKTGLPVPPNPGANAPTGPAPASNPASVPKQSGTPKPSSAQGQNAPGEAGRGQKP
jgi:hypothetical protein